LYEIVGSVHVIGGDGEEMFAGRFRVYYLDAERAVQESMPLFDVLWITTNIRSPISAPSSAETHLN
jgi:lipid-A-disaccharide synthase-like uncharacterized protein